MNNLFKKNLFFEIIDIHALKAPKNLSFLRLTFTKNSEGMIFFNIAVINFNLDL